MLVLVLVLSEAVLAIDCSLGPNERLGDVYHRQPENVESLVVNGFYGRQVGFR